MQASPSSNERKLESSPATVKPCVKCGSTERHKPRPGHKLGRCKACNEAITKAYLKANPKKRLAVNTTWRETHPEKYAAHNAVRVAVRRGDLPKVSTLSCVDCGIQASEYHHEDYTKPLDVEALCISCHNKRHLINP